MTFTFLSSLVKASGSCIYRRGESLREATKDIPNEPGVYIICNHEDDIIYIGKAGTIQQNGVFKRQGLHGRLNNKQNGMARQSYFNSRMMSEEIPHICIRWYELKEGIIPGCVEGQLIQEYFNANKELPTWNEGF